MIDGRLKFECRHVHFTGIGGIGMSGLGEILVRLGYTVSGSDMKMTPLTERLKALGVKIHAGHQESHVHGADLLVYSAAVGADNPERIAAVKQGINMVSRADLLGGIFRKYRGIAVAGTHGKTTTSAMISKMLIDAQMDPTLAIGGIMPELHSNVRLGQGDWMIAEADEYDRSFHTLSPELSVITSLDADHLEYYKTEDAVDEAFLTFIHMSPFDKPIIVCADDPGVNHILPDIRRRKITYGTVGGARIKADELSLSVDSASAKIIIEDTPVGDLRIQRPGKYHMLNALAAIAVAVELEIPMETALKSLADFKGIERRFEVKGVHRGVTVIDDYAHHPTEIQAVLDGITESGRVTLIFQPHLYSRTRDLARQFGQALSHPHIERCIVTDIFPSREAPICGVTSELLVRAGAEAGGQIEYVPDMYEAVSSAASTLRTGDILMTMGAGDIYLAGEKFMDGTSLAG